MTIMTMLMLTIYVAKSEECLQHEGKGVGAECQCQQLRRGSSCEG